MSQSKYVLMSIKPQFAKLIRDGKKKVELRRVAPKVNAGDTLIMYESAPVSKVTAIAEIEDVVQLTLTELWEIVGHDSMLKKDEFVNYFSGRDVGYGIMLKKVQEILSPKSLSILPGCVAPQNFRYLSESEFEMLCL